MKKIVALFFSICAATHALTALPMGSPVEPAALVKGVWFSEPCCDPYYTSIFNNWSVCLGYYGDFVFNRYLEVDGTGTGVGKTIDETYLYTNAAYLAFNLCRRFEIFGTLGATTMQIRTTEDAWNPLQRHEGTLYTNTHFSWSVGGRVFLLNWRCLGLGVEGQYFHARPQFDKYYSNFFINIPTYFNNAPQMTYHEWQAGGALSYTIHPGWPNIAITPYTGFKWANARLKTDDFTFVDAAADTVTIFSLTAKKNYGFVVGSSFVFGEQVSMTVEGRFFDEKALYVNGQICF